MNINEPLGRGSYLLVMYTGKAIRLKVGRLGVCRFDKGFYVYIGSAMGAGGLTARINRHLRTEKKCHWHLDYLRPHVTVKFVYYQQSRRIVEHRWAKQLSVFADGGQPIKGFGSSDCGCYSHLLYFHRMPDLKRRLPGNGLKSLSDLVLLRNLIYKAN